jgi:hypothetical protein
LRVGDFDKNGISDILCDDNTAKKNYFTLFDSSQRVKTTWTWSTTWCTGATNEYVDLGTFRGNGKQQLMCHNYAAGVVHFLDIQAALGSGASFNIGCLGVNQHRSRLFVRRLNDDEFDDLVCYWTCLTAPAYTKVSVAPGTTTGAFGRIITFLDTTTTCPFGSYLDTGHFNNDRFLDLVCVTGTGSDREIKIFLAKDGNFKFTGVDWKSSYTMCTADATLYTGDFIGRGCSQLLCHGRDGTIDIKKIPLL